MTTIAEPRPALRPADDPVAATSPRLTARDTASQTLSMSWRALKKMRRNPEQFLDVTIFPLLFTAMFGYIFGGAIAGDVASYLPVLVPGLIAMQTLTTCIATGVTLREDMDKGVFDRLASLPISRFAPLAGPMIADLVRYFVGVALTFVAGIVMGYRPDGGVLGVTGAIVLAMIAGWSLAWVFSWLSTIARTARGVQGMSMMVLFPATFLSNAFVPAESLPGWLEAFVEVNPVSHIVSAVRDLANDGAVTGQVGWALVGCAAVVAIFAPLAIRSVRRRM